MLEKYKFPDALKEMPIDKLELLSYDVRDFLLEKISKCGGHLASNLGVVELSIALLKALDLPKDKLIWDVGHQSYVHKILTGRAGDFDSLRKLDGLSGFPKRSESEYDFFDSGHASNSISAAYGLAKARDLKGEKYNVCCVIGDGALTGGLAYEAMNNVGESKTRLIVVLNDNQMSITKNRGAISNHLGKLRLSEKYLGLKSNVKEKLAVLPGSSGKSIYTALDGVKRSFKYMLIEGAPLFEELGFTYLGPVDGHNIAELLEALELAKNSAGPILLHVVTKKGKGFLDAEKEPNKFHGVGKFKLNSVEEKSAAIEDSGTAGSFDPAENKNAAEEAHALKSLTYSEIFGSRLLRLAADDERICAVTAAMTEGTGLEKFQNIFPERCFDAGIAEEHAVSFAAGLALSGMKPVVAIYSTFLQRAYDQILMDVCMQNLPVVFAIDRAGCVGEDGPTHHGLFDLSYLSHMPNLTLLVPKDGKELEEMLCYALKLNTPAAIRYPRGKNRSCEDFAKNYNIEEGSELIKTGRDAELWAVGKMVEIGREACDKLSGRYDIGLINARFAKPLDGKALYESARRCRNIITLEDNVISGGFGNSVASMLNFLGANGPEFARVSNIAWPNKFIEQGATEELLKRYFLDSASVAERISDIIERGGKSERKA